MNLKIFGCPRCQQPFQVEESPLAQVVQCPSCSQTVEVPASSRVVPPPAEQLAYRCPQCDGSFGITQGMIGHHVGCPHCQKSVLVKPAGQSFEEVPVPRIDTRAKAKRKSSNSGRRWKSTEKIEPPQESAPTGNPDEPERTPEPQTGDERGSIPVTRRRSDSPGAAGGSVTPIAESESAAEEQLERDLLPPSNSLKPAAKRKAKPSRGGSGKTASKGKKDKQVSKRRQPAKPSASARPSVDREEPAVSGEPSVPNTPPSVAASETAKGVSNTASSSDGESVASGLSEPHGMGELESVEPNTEAIEHLLPPRFDVLDPSRLSLETGKNQFKVVLPDGQGGRVRSTNG